MEPQLAADMPAVVGVLLADALRFMHDAPWR